MKNVWLLESEEKKGGVGRSNSIVTRDTQKQKGARRRAGRQAGKKENSIPRKNGRYLKKRGSHGTKGEKERRAKKTIESSGHHR